MMDALKRMKPTCIEDIVALVALYRPGPMENIPTYCEVKNGLRERESIHPLIDNILEETPGIIVYQEKVTCWLIYSSLTLIPYLHEPCQIMLE